MIELLLCICFPCRFPRSVVERRTLCNSSRQSPLQQQQQHQQRQKTQSPPNAVHRADAPLMRHKLQLLPSSTWESGTSRRHRQHTDHARTGRGGRSSCVFVATGSARCKESTAGSSSLPRLPLPFPLLSLCSCEWLVCCAVLCCCQFLTLRRLLTARCRHKTSTLADRTGAARAAHVLDAGTQQGNTVWHLARTTCVVSSQLIPPLCT
jgi:hypothetical protein